MGLDVFKGLYCQCILFPLEFVLPVHTRGEGFGWVWSEEIGEAVLTQIRTGLGNVLGVEFGR